MNNQHFSPYIPVGFIMPFAGSINNNIEIDIESKGWILCDGRMLNACEYPELYEALGGIYGEKKEGDEVLFNIPNYRSLFLNSLNTEVTTGKRPEDIGVNYFIKYTNNLPRLDVM